jgi:hypothetical protein
MKIGFLYEPPPSERGYVAPTVYKLGGVTLGGYNYYNTLQEAELKALYLGGKGGYNVPPAGSIPLTSSEPTTFGINVDFYLYKDGAFANSSYAELKRLGINHRMIAFRFWRTDGSGPYYSVLDYERFGISATSVASVSPEKLAQLDALYRAVELLKYRYNSLVGFLNNLAMRQLTAKEQQIFNEGSLRLQNLRVEMQQLDGVEFRFTSTGAVVHGIGFVPLLIIAAIVIIAAVTGWTITQIADMREKTQRINDAYQLNQWVTQKKIEVAQMAAAGAISNKDAASIQKSLDKASTAANEVAGNAAKDAPGTLDNVITIAKIAGIFILGKMAFDMLQTKRAPAASP